MATSTKTHSNLFWTDPAESRASVPRLAVLLLNAPHSSWHIKRQIGPHSKIHASELFWNLWSNAHLTVCADGGANRLYDRSVKVEALDVVRPQYIKGDLDSLRDDVREFYAQKGTTIIQDPDQDTNDLDKCLQLIHDLQEQQDADKGKFSVMVFGAMGGRFDQEMQSINALFRWSERFQQIVLLSKETTVRLLLPGIHHVIEPNFHFEARTCGLVPIAGACSSTTTTGLKWNLNGQEMKFGGLVSSSNHVDDAHDVVHVESSHPLIWTTELKK
ncbi:Thiamine pyrophosphokinase, partial [Globisporangium splendens]